MTKDVYTSIGNMIMLAVTFKTLTTLLTVLRFFSRCDVSVKSLEAHFLYHKLSFPTGSTGIDANRPDMARLLKQVCVNVSDPFYLPVKLSRIKLV